MNEWDQLPGEKARAYQAFWCYVLSDSVILDEAQARSRRWRRSIRKAWAIYRERSKKAPKNPPGYFRDWCAAHRWGERAKAWDKRYGRKRRDRLELQEYMLQEMMGESEPEPEQELNARYVIDPETGESVLQIEFGAGNWVSVRRQGW